MRVFLEMGTGQWMPFVVSQETAKKFNLIPGQHCDAALSSKIFAYEEELAK